jgi:hypothetical protein
MPTTLRRRDSRREAVEPVGEPGWEPGDPVERELAAALARGDGPGYVRLLSSARLFVPLLPGPDADPRVAGLLPPGAPYVLVFTSLESLSWALGDLAGEYGELDLAELRQRWPDPRHRLAVNPGSPIATFLPLDQLDQLAAGRRSLVAVGDVAQTVAEQERVRIRRACLRELAAGDPAAAAPRDDPPANPLETRLREASERADPTAFLWALLDARAVVVPTTAPVSDPARIHDDGFPWWILGGDELLAVPIFSSRAALERTGAAGTPSVEVPFLDVIDNWPGVAYPLVVNPGSVIELVLSGDQVADLVGAIADAIDQPG